MTSLETAGMIVLYVAGMAFVWWLVRSQRPIN